MSFDDLLSGRRLPIAELFVRYLNLYQRQLARDPEYLRRERLRLDPEPF